MQLAKTVVAVIGIAALSYFTVTSIEHTLGSRDVSDSFVGRPTTTGALDSAIVPQSTTGTTSVAGPCATLPDLTCAPDHYPTGEAQELPPQF